METLEETFDHDRALVFGVGGCGDIVSTIPTARLLESHGVDIVLGGVAWERVVVDPTPGPRHFEEITGIEQLNDAAALASAETATQDGIEFAETHVARQYDEEVLLIDIGGGARGVAKGLDDACDQLDIDLVVGTDAGGDVLAAGDEPGIKSPLTDAVMLSVLDLLNVDTCLGMYGYGSDGELTLDEITAGIGRAARRDGLLGAWGLTPRIVDELDALLDEVTTEANRLPVEAARGKLGDEAIRDGERSVELTPASTVTFYLDPAAVAAGSALDTHVRDTESFEAAHEALSQAGYETELDLERRLTAQ
ncbi:DUF1152 domain-containing protein [Halococcus saccharolyticus]|uniref:DUF1152 domain-containing protein n=1 Tax=Halococcus saccharolyticus DSM 5350 TaxID=1227455 RepID=M0MMV4_9EURY|nr:DUF1152 domain-containing protein [Halococcus saccharolyticus]EMA46059.1 hypothetical protein C449_05122 [Halococcus saccharolyticus DSM 5350]